MSQSKLQQSGKKGGVDCTKKVNSVISTWTHNINIFKSLYGITFPGVSLFEEEHIQNCQAAFGRFKYLTSGLLDSLFSGETHPLTHIIEQRTRKEQILYASTLVSFKKRQPGVCSCMMSELEAKHKKIMQTVCDDLPQGFEQHVRETVLSLFPTNWDRNYQKYVSAATKPLTSCIESNTKNGGVHNGFEGTQQEYREYLTKKQDYFLQNAPLVKYTLIQDKGKARGITINNSEHFYLKPLHKMMYDHISKFEWLHRGDCNNESLHSLRLAKGEFFISADYESATDNFNPKISKLILETALSRACKIPEHIRYRSELSLFSKIQYTDGEIIQPVRGQLMGNFLSFPLLCLYNYVCLKFYCPDIKDKKIKINGDDLLTCMTLEQYNHWSTNISKLGMKLSTGKTAVSKKFASLNSTYFWYEYDKKKLYQMSNIRFGMLEKPETNCHLETARNFYYFYKHMPQKMKATCRFIYMREHKRFLLHYGQSLTLPEPIGLNLNLTSSELRKLDILDVELFNLHNTNFKRRRNITPSGNNFKTPDQVLRVDATEDNLNSFIKEDPRVISAFTEENWLTNIDVSTTEDRFKIYNEKIKAESLFIKRKQLLLDDYGRLLDRKLHSPLSKVAPSTRSFLRYQREARNKCPVFHKKFYIYKENFPVANDMNTVITFRDLCEAYGSVRYHTQFEEEQIKLNINKLFQNHASSSRPRESKYSC